MDSSAQFYLPWWLALATMAAFFVDSFRRRYRSGVVRPWLRTSAGELWANAIGVYVVFGLPQISDTILTSPPWGMLDGPERWGVVRIFLLVPLATIAAIVVPKVVPTPGLIERRENGLPTTEALKTLALRVTLVIVGARLLGWLAWQGAMSTRLVTIELVAVFEAATIVAYLILIGRVIDHVFGPTPWRIVAGLLVAPTLFLLYGAAMPTDYVQHSEPVAAQAPEKAGSDAPPVPHEWYSAARARLDKLPDDGPVIFVAASGGGSRAALFAGLVMETMALEPDKIALPDGAGETLYPSWKRPLADYVFAISSVSGGSVAAAQFAAAASDAKFDVDADAATSLMWPSVLDPDSWVADDEAQDGMAKLVLARRGVLPQLLVNFNAVAVRGFLSPGDTRGRSLADFWEHHLRWTERIRGGTPGSSPLLLINATLVESGRGLVVGYPSVPQHLFLEGSRHGVLQLAPAQSDRITRVSLTRLDEEGTVRVGDAVRLSASFPFGMDSARLDDLDRNEQAVVGNPGVDHVHVSDGGVLDNTGTGTIRELLSGILEAADQGIAGAQEVVDILKARGVLVVEIDSGAKPVTANGGVIARMFGPVTQSSTVLAQAAYTAEREAVFLRRSALERSGLDVYWATFSYCPRTDGEEVMTAWGLGPGDQIKLIEQYFSNTLTGNCARRQIPVYSAHAQSTADVPSPLGSVSAAFQPSAPKDSAEALQFVPDDADPKDPAIARLLLTAVDQAALSGHVERATTAAARLESVTAANDAVTLSMMGPGMALGTAGRVHTIDDDDARQGWFLAARFTERDGGARPTLDWSVLWEDSSDGLDRYQGREVALARPVFLHRGTEADSFHPGRVVALADRHARVRIEALKVESTGGRRSVYAYASWGGAISLARPCTDLTYTIRVCEGNEGRADALVEHLVTGGHLRRACLRVTQASPAETGKGDAIEAIEALEGDSKAIEEWTRGAFGRRAAMRTIIRPTETGIGVRLCE